MHACTALLPTALSLTYLDDGSRDTIVTEGNEGVELTCELVVLGEIECKEERLELLGKTLIWHIYAFTAVQ